MEEDRLEDIRFADMLAECEREQAMRRNVYPRMIVRGQIAPGQSHEVQQHTARLRMRRLQAVIEFLKPFVEKERGQLKLFGKPK